MDKLGLPEEHWVALVFLGFFLCADYDSVMKNSSESNLKEGRNLQLWQHKTTLSSSSQLRTNKKTRAY